MLQRCSDTSEILYLDALQRFWVQRHPKGFACGTALRDSRCRDILKAFGAEMLQVRWVHRYPKNVACAESLCMCRDPGCETSQMSSILWDKPLNTWGCVLPSGDTMSCETALQPQEKFDHPHYGERPPCPSWSPESNGEGSWPDPAQCSRTELCLSFPAAHQAADGTKHGGNYCLEPNIGDRSKSLQESGNHGDTGVPGDTS